MPKKEYVLKAIEAMKARFSNFIVTPEQIEAWRIGFSWIHEYAYELAQYNSNWRVLPECVAPLLSGRPDLIVDTGTHLLVIEMKTGHKTSKSTGERQVLNYADDFWGKLKIGRFRTVIPIILTDKKINQKSKAINYFEKEERPTQVLRINLSLLIELSKSIYSTEEVARIYLGDKTSEWYKYSPRPTVVEAAISLVSSMDDKNITTGLAETDEIRRIISLIQKRAEYIARDNAHEVIVITGAPGAGKTLVGLRIAHDRNIQELLPSEIGTPLYLTGNAPLVEVLIESLARDEVRRIGNRKNQAISNANTKVRLVHSVTEKKLGIESNVIVFDEGQRIWTEERMQLKRRDKTLGSEAEEILKYLQKLPWSLAVVLIGEGQEINVGEEGFKTWLKAVEKINSSAPGTWKITVPKGLVTQEKDSDSIQLDDYLTLKVNQRTDNAADISLWTTEFLKGNFEGARRIKDEFREYPFYFTRNLETAKHWLREKANREALRCGLVASSTSKRLVLYGIDALSSAERNFNWANWYLNDLPDLSSSSVLEVAASEYKCQGLELDLVGVCWSWDLIPEKSNWQPRTLRADKSKWKNTDVLSSKFKFQINSYRVLLTRSRKGMVVWIPRGDSQDPSRRPSEMDSVALAFQQSGVTEI